MRKIKVASIFSLLFSIIFPIRLLAELEWGGGVDPAISASQLDGNDPIPNLHRGPSLT